MSRENTVLNGRYASEVPCRDDCKEIARVTLNTIKRENYTHDDTWGGIADVLRLHQYVRYTLDFEANPRLDGPVETLNRGWGDCEDKSILFYTLLEGCTKTVRIVSIDGHVLCEWKKMNIPNKESTPGDLLKERYKKYLNKDIGEVAYEAEYDHGGDREYWWLIADLTLGDYIGDISGLIDNGHIRRTSTGWEWTGFENYEKQGVYRNQGMTPP